MKNVLTVIAIAT